MPLSRKLRRRGNQCSIVCASSVTTCFALRRKILTPSNARIVIRVRPSQLRPTVILTPAHVSFHASFSYNLRHTIMNFSGAPK